MGNQAASRFGQDAPSRITIAPSMFLEASAVMPNEPAYYPVVPFYPASITTGNPQNLASNLSALDSGSDDWKAYPDKLDLFWWQGDDVQIQLVFPGETDMSTWEWHADVRHWPSYVTHLHYEFIISAEFFPEVVEVLAVPADPLTPDIPAVEAVAAVPAHTTITLFLPRQLNASLYKGHWELHSVSPYEGPDFPVATPFAPYPPGLSAENWPPTTQLKTWVYGNVTVVPRTNDTDYLPGEVPVVPVQPTFIMSSYGPNGRVP